MRPKMKKPSSHENETLAERKVRLERGSRGKSAESKVQDVLSEWRVVNQEFDFDRLLDSKSAGKIVAAQVSDFLIFHRGRSATLEVKQIKKGTRLAKSKFPQHPRMLRRELTGCKGFLIAFTQEEPSLWWVARVINMKTEVPSWKLENVAAPFNTVKSALEYVLEEM